MPKASILIVEDSFIVAYHLQATLEGEGYTVVGKCDSGEAAIAFAEVNQPDLVLMDIMLTGAMDGIESAATLKARFNIPVIYITALTDKETISRAKVTEPYGYLTKPFEDHEIFTVIEMALYKHDIESRLRQSEAKYFSTVNSISDAVVSIDRNCRITFMNPTALAMTQWTFKAAMDKPVTDVLNLRNNATLEVRVNPVQCPVGMGRINKMPDNLVLIGKNASWAPIGESSMSHLLDNKGNFTGLIIVFKDLTEREARDKLVKELERSRKAALIEGQEKERSRIAKDMHDGLGQMLNAIKMNTKILARDNEAEESLSRLLEEAIQESVRISENLLPAKLRDFDLAVCLRSLCNDIKNSTRSQISFEAHGLAFAMGQSQKINFYRIAQEAINNSIKHAHAEIISVQLNESGGIVRLSMEDNGKGFSEASPPAANRQNGLINMRDRTEIMGGELTIESDPQRGTLVIVEVPTINLITHEEI